jgi:molybdopterin-binding protein
MNTRFLSSIAGTVVGSLLIGLGPALAAPGGAHGAPGGLGPKPNGVPPVGAPAVHGDTDRGHSEGKGRNDLGKTHVIGTVSAINGNMVTVRSGKNTVQTFTLTPAQAAEVRSGEHIVFFTNGATVTRIAPANMTLHATVLNVVPSSLSHKTMVTVRLPNGRTQTMIVANEAAENMKLRKGEPVVLTTTNAFLTQPTITVVQH